MGGRPLFCRCCLAVLAQTGFISVPVLGFAKLFTMGGADVWWLLDIGLPFAKRMHDE